MITLICSSSLDHSLQSAVGVGSEAGGEGGRGAVVSGGAGGDADQEGAGPRELVCSVRGLGSVVLMSDY